MVLRFILVAPIYELCFKSVWQGPYLAPLDSHWHRVPLLHDSDLMLANLGAAFVL